MKLRLLYPLLLMTVLSLPALAQMPSRTTGEIETSPYYTHHKLFAKVNFISIFDPQTPTIQTGIEYKLTKRLALEVNVGIPVRLNDSWNTDTTYWHHYKVKAELRFFPGQSLFYLGPELFFVKKKRSRFDGIYRDKDEAFSYTFAELNKTVIGFAVKIGRVWELSDRWALDGFFALGTRYIHLDVKARGVQSEPGYRAFWWTSDRKGSSVGLHSALGVKVAYALK